MHKINSKNNMITLLRLYLIWVR